MFKFRIRLSFCTIEALSWLTKSFDASFLSCSFSLFNLWIYKNVISIACLFIVVDSRLEQLGPELAHFSLILFDFVEEGRLALLVLFDTGSIDLEVSLEDVVVWVLRRLELPAANICIFILGFGYSEYLDLVI